MNQGPSLYAHLGDQMNIPVLNGLAELADDYDLFIFDLWGVIHNGEAVFPGAVDCLHRLRQRGARIVFMSNAARLSPSVAAQLADLGVTQDLYDWLLTSGDATADAIAASASGSGANARPTWYHIGPEGRTRSTLDACAGRETNLKEAEIIICTGLVDALTEQAEDYRSTLVEGVERGLTMVCVNPDVIVSYGGRTFPCAGALAALYEELGGTVQRFGKPFPAIFDRLFAESPEIPRARAVMIGDSLATDIRGARQAGFDAIWIAGGIHADALALGPDGHLRSDKVEAVAEEAGERPRAILPWLNW